MPVVGSAERMEPIFFSADAPIASRGPPAFHIEWPDGESATCAKRFVRKCRCRIASSRELKRGITVARTRTGHTRIEQIANETQSPEKVLKLKLTGLVELKQSLLQKVFSGKQTAGKETPIATLKEEEVA